MNKTKTILGLDLGTNSIGWALINQDLGAQKGAILGLGSRIIPMTQDVMGKFDSGQTISQTAERTGYRSARKLYQRDNLRRERLHRVLNILGFLPEHYKNEIDFEIHKGQFINHSEPKLPYKINQKGKFEFLFMDSYLEMLEEFKIHQPQLLESGKKIPYDWLIYFLRKKALKDKISKHELAWLILNFNQKRGYYQLSEEEDEGKDDNQEYVVLKVKRVEDTGEVFRQNGNKQYRIIFENDWIYDKPISKPEDWENKEREFIVTTKLLKDGELKRTFKSVDSTKDWLAIKKKTENDLGGQTIGEYVFGKLLQNPKQKINGKLISTIERKFYKTEFESILKRQIEFHAELNDKDLYNKSVLELYPNNEGHRRNVEKRDFMYLIKDDILFYQRPLKTKIHLISDCSLEYRIRRDTGEKVYVKCIAKSNPLFQEFRLWQFLKNVRIYENENDKDVTSEFLSKDEKIIDLYDFLNDKETVNQKQLLKKLGVNENTHRWNYVDKDYPCNETRAKFLNRIKKIDGVDSSFFDRDNTQRLWHILYSVTDPNQRKTALQTFAKQFKLCEEFAVSFGKFPLFKKEYGSFSEKAIKKMLTLMRLGQYWNESAIGKLEVDRINSIITRLESIEYNLDKINQVADDDISATVLKSFVNSGGAVKGLNTFQASYLIYGRHSETADTSRWETSKDIEDYLNPNLKNSFRQHSLRNPVVEQVIAETLRVIKDVWDEFGNGEKGFFDEIHIELGREMKNPANKRKQMSERGLENEITNLRVRAILEELQLDGLNVRPYSPSHQEILKIYEEGVYFNPNASFDKLNQDEIFKIRKNSSPSKSDIQRYKLWLEQGYISPYTGQIIMLSELFTTKYQIEHIFPQSRLFDDSFNNKIICESEVNKLKDNQTAFEFMSAHGGETVELGKNKTVRISTLEVYEKHVKSYFSKNRAKRDNLLSPDIPDSFINRQLNDSRYISKVVKSLLSRIVREKDEQEATSKHVISVTGAITSKMKQDWGLNDVWNDIITPRFVRLNELTQSADFGEINPNTNKFLPTVPESLSKGFNKKRIDHRHHALDALVIACITRSHINYLNNLNAQESKEKIVKQELRELLCHKTKVDENGNYNWSFNKPFEEFTETSKKMLLCTVASFKQNNRVINKSKNKYQKWGKDEKGGLKKVTVTQDKGENWAIRKSLHKATVYGEIEITVDGKKVKATSGRIKLSDKFTEKQLNSVADTAIQKILLQHIQNYKDEKGNPQFNLAFSVEGIEDLNENIVKLNGGKFHQPIYNVRVFEKGNRFQVGTNGNKANKMVEADKGTNLFFAVYWNEKKQKREFETIPLNEVIAHQKIEAHLPKNERTEVPINKEKGEFLFCLSPNDLVYVPTQEELENPKSVDLNQMSFEQTKRIYKMVSSTGSECHFIQNHVSSLIMAYNSKTKMGEYGSLNKLEITESLEKKERIKEVCWKLNINRIGKVTSYYYSS